jgi:hypothetical protein
VGTKAVGAFICAKYLSKWLGKETGMAAALFLTYDAIRTAIPFDQWIADAMPGHNPAEFGRTTLTPTTQPEPAPAPVRTTTETPQTTDYYAGLYR